MSGNLTAEQLAELRAYWREHRERNGCQCGMQFEPAGGQQTGPHAPGVGRWIAAATLDRFPNGPYAVHAYFPRTQREMTLRNQTTESAAVQAAEFAALNCDVHVSLDTCG